MAFGISCHLRKLKKKRKEKIGGKKREKQKLSIHFTFHVIQDPQQTNESTNERMNERKGKKNFDGKTDILSNKQNETKCQQTT